MIYGTWYAFQMRPVREFLRETPLRANWRLGPAIQVGDYIVSGHRIVHSTACRRSVMRKLVTEPIRIYAGMDEALQWLVNRIVASELEVVTSITVTDYDGAFPPSKSAVIVRTPSGTSAAFSGPYLVAGAELCPTGVLYLAKPEVTPPMLVYYMNSTLAYGITSLRTDADADTEQEPPCFLQS